MEAREVKTAPERSNLEEEGCRWGGGRGKTLVTAVVDQSLLVASWRGAGTRFVDGLGRVWPGPYLPRRVSRDEAPRSPAPDTVPGP